MSKNKKTVDKYITYGILIVIYAIAQIMASTGVMSNLVAGVLVPASTYILLAISLNLVVGFSGELSLGHAGFACVGAYAGGLFSLIMQNTITEWWLRFPLAIILGGIIAAIAGFLIGIPVLRLRGDYLAIVTLAFGEIIRKLLESVYLVKDANGFFITLNSKDYVTHTFEGEKIELIRGANGIMGTRALVPREWLFFVAFVVIMISIVIILNLIDSKTGRSIKAARDNRIAAEAMGVNVTRAKMTAFVTASFIAGMAGAIYAHSYNIVKSSTFSYNMSIYILGFVVLGGMKSMRKVALTTIVLYMLLEVVFRKFTSYRLILYAIALIVMMLFNNNEKCKQWKEKHSFKALLSRFGKKGGAN